MADFDTGDVIRLGCVQKYANADDVVNVLHVQLTAGGGQTFAAMTVPIAQYCSALYDTIKSLVSTQVTADYISVKNVTQNTVWGNMAWGTYTGGTNANDPLPQQVAMLVYGRTAISRVQIRKYLGVFCEDGMLAGAWTAAARATSGFYISYFIVGQTHGTGQVLQGCAYNPLLSRVTFATSYNTSAVPVIQRRRRRGRGS